MGLIFFSILHRRDYYLETVVTELHYELGNFIIDVKRPQLDMCFELQLLSNWCVSSTDSVPKRQSYLRVSVFGLVAFGF